MKPMVFATFLFLIATPATGFADDAGAAGATLPPFAQMSLTDLKAVDSKQLGKADRKLYKAALKAAEKAERARIKAEKAALAAKRRAEAAAQKAEAKRLKAEQKRLRAETRKIRDSYRQSDVFGPDETGSYLVDGRQKHQVDWLHGSAVWAVRAGGDAYRGWFDVRLRKEYRYDAPFCPEDLECEPARFNARWDFYGRASVRGVGRLEVKTHDYYINNCTMTFCWMVEDLTISLPPHLAFAAIRDRSAIAVSIGTPSGYSFNINITYTRLIGLVRKVHDALGYYGELVRIDPLVAAEIAR